MPQIRQVCRCVAGRPILGSRCRPQTPSRAVSVHRKDAQMTSHSAPSPGALPIILLVSSEASALTALESDLDRRFGNDTRIVTADGPADGIAKVTALADAGEPVGLVIADQRMPEMTGIEFLGRAHALHP